MAAAPNSSTASRIIPGIAILLVCQLAGEALVQLAGIPIEGLAFPGPVVGMVILFVVLLIARTRVENTVGPVADGLLANLSLLFVPAAVGIVQYGPVLAEFGMALVVALIVSTVLTLLVTVGVFIAVQKAIAKGESDDA